jgi:hypothetical protein
MDSIWFWFLSFDAFVWGGPSSAMGLLVDTAWLSLVGVTWGGDTVMSILSPRVPEAGLVCHANDSWEWTADYS